MPDEVEPVTMTDGVASGEVAEELLWGEACLSSIYPSDETRAASGRADARHGPYRHVRRMGGFDGVSGLVRGSSSNSSSPRSPSDRQPATRASSFSSSVFRRLCVRSNS